jgi:predicted oxidoreductase (fatty acid repression mutant protein)
MTKVQIELDDLKCIVEFGRKQSALWNSLAGNIDKILSAETVAKRRTKLAAFNAALDRATTVIVAKEALILSDSHQATMAAIENALQPKDNASS